MTRLGTPRIGGTQLVRSGGGIGRGLGGRTFDGGPVRPVPDEITFDVWGQL